MTKDIKTFFRRVGIGLLVICAVIAIIAAVIFLVYYMVHWKYIQLVFLFVIAIFLFYKIGKEYDDIKK